MSFRKQQLSVVLQLGRKSQLVKCSPSEGPRLVLDTLCGLHMESRRPVCWHSARQWEIFWRHRARL